MAMADQGFPIPTLSGWSTMHPSSSSSPFKIKHELADSNPFNPFNPFRMRGKVVQLGSANCR
ncbi:MAG: hypothetical protein QOK41_1745 [Sphingomonadales bacterium]|nr:hypothetical protein [Sphingomonadales bacterium]